MWLQGARLTVDTETLSDETNRIVDSRSGTGSAANPSEVNTEKIFVNHLKILQYASFQPEDMSETEQLVPNSDNNGFVN